MALTRDDVMKALKECYDPEIPVNIVDLGLVYDVAAEEGTVNVKMTLTARGCPMHAMISDNVRRRLLELEGVTEANVEMVWDPPWTQDMITEEGKKALGLI
jgi:metal-sulfur cluster biosynthetic enzyme